MGSIIGKQYQNKSNGNLIKVVSIEGNIAILENDQRISVERLLDGSHYIEHSMSVNESASVNSNVENPMNNEGALYSNLLSQIQGLDDNAINMASDTDGGAQVGEFINPVESHAESQQRLNGGANVYDDEEPSHKEMLQKARQNQLDLETQMKKQSSKLGKTFEGIEGEVNIPVNRNFEGVKVEGQGERETSVNMVEDVGSNVKMNRDEQRKPVEEPVNPMFKKMKRTQKVTLKIDIEEMVPTKDLLKMLEEGFEDSVLDYLTDEIAGKVLSDSVIKSQIKEKLNEYVYGKTRKTTAKKTATKKTTAKKPTAKKTTTEEKTIKK